MRLAAALLCITGLLASGCGTPGAPQPPSLGIPKQVSDLRALRKGNTVTLTWTAPTETTDGELVRKPGKMILTRAVSGPAQKVSELPLQPAVKEENAPPPQVKDSLGDLLENGADFATYTVTAENNSGKGAGPSNPAAVPLVPVPSPPAQVNASPVPQGISISWSQAWPPQNQSHLNTEYVYRIMRRETGSKNSATIKQLSAGSSAMALIDTGIEWQKHYDYWITPVTLWQGAGRKGEVEGEDSPVVAVFANDTFPPAVPSGLEAVFSATAGQSFIDLSWAPDTEPDLAGYNVYRRNGDEAPLKVNAELVKTSSFRDTNVAAGRTYFYSVAAVDLRGNESEKSSEASESVPQQ